MSNPTPPPPNTNGIVLNLLLFDKIVSLDECGLLYTEVYNPQFDAYDAIANVNVDLKTFSNMFCFETDHIDVNDVSGTDVKYYVLSPKIQTFTPNLGSSIVGTNPIVSFASNGSTESDQLIGKDFTRYLASLLFNTPYGTDLFINETALVNSVNSALLTAWSYCMIDLQNVSNTSTNSDISMVGNVPAKYLTNDFSGVQNICRELFLQLISKSPARFTNLPQIQVEDVNVVSIREASHLNYYYLPFVNNDIVQLRVKVYPCVHQPTFGLSTTDTTKFETINNDTKLKGRTYLMNMILTDNFIPPPLLNTFSMLVVGKNATLSSATVLNQLPIVISTNIMTITPIAIQINANCVRVDIAYTISPTATSSQILDVGVGFNNVWSWYNTNIQSIVITQFGGIPLYGRGNQFKSLLSDITFSATDSPLISSMTSLQYAFSDMLNFNQNVNFLNNWNLLNVTSMGFMFNNCSKFNNGGYPLTLTTSSLLTNLERMFASCVMFNQPVTITNTSSVNNISRMFLSCVVFNQRFTITNLEKVSSIDSMFNNCNKFNNGGYPLTLTTSSLLKNTSYLFRYCRRFNQPVTISNMNEVTTMVEMFSSCVVFNQRVKLGLQTPDILGNVWDINIPKITTLFSAFTYCLKFNNGGTSGANPITFFTGTGLTNLDSLFSSCSEFNQKITISNITNVTTMNSAFMNSPIFNNGYNSGDTNNRLFPNKPLAITSATSFGSTILLNGNRPTWLSNTWTII
jgi:hypothetical protein